MCRSGSTAKRHFRGRQSWVTASATKLSSIEGDLKMADQDVANPAGGHNGRHETRERSSTVRDYVSIIFRRRKLLTWTFLGTFLGALLVTVLVMNYRYQPELKILVQYQRYNPLVTPGQTREQSQSV